MKTTDYCGGCRDDFYNGNNDIGVARCWHLDNAALDSVILVPLDMRPPYKRLPRQKRPSCYKASGYATVKPADLDSQGYWKR